jgi:hypothetical protein
VAHGSDIVGADRREREGGVFNSNRPAPAVETPVLPWHVSVGPPGIVTTERPHPIGQRRSRPLSARRTGRSSPLPGGRLPVAAEHGRGDAQHRVDEHQLQVMVPVALLDEGQRGEQPLTLDEMRGYGDGRVWCTSGASLSGL